MTQLSGSMIKQRRKKIIFWTLLFAVLLGSCCVATYFYKGYLIKQFIAKGKSAVRRLASHCQSPMLKYVVDPTELPLVPRNEINDDGHLAYTLIYRDGKILDSSDNKMLLVIYIPPQNRKQIQEDGPITIYEEYQGKMRVVTFSSDIITRVGNANLGKIIISYNASTIDNKVIFFLAASLIACSVFMGILWIISISTSHKPDDSNHIKNFKLIKPINEGGMANLWVAVSDDDSLGKKYAVKIAKDLPSETLQTFDDEARLVSNMDHSNIVKVHFYFENEHAIVMDYVEGEDLGLFLNRLRGNLETRHIIYIILEICEGLIYAHSLVAKDTKKVMNIVHRDIKPANILVADDGGVKITDFGIAKANIFDPGKTQFGDVKGTLAYMSPEQALGERDIDHRSDIYSLGIIFYEMITGKPLHTFEGGINFRTAIQIVSEKEVPPITEKKPHLDEELNRIVMKCLEKEKTKRYQNVDEIKNDLKVYMRNAGTPFSKAELKASLVDIISEYKIAETVVKPDTNS